VYIKVWTFDERKVEHLFIGFFEPDTPSEAVAIERATKCMTANPDAHWATYPTGHKRIPGVYEGPRNKEL